MNRIQKHIFGMVMGNVAIIIFGLTIIAILAQGLSRTELLVDNRQTVFTYLQVIALGAPQIIALLTPIALFVATIWALDKLRRSNALVIAQSAGLSRWQLASPVLRLVSLAMVLHLGVNFWVQPAAQQEMREVVQAARADILSTLVQAGQFRQANESLTFYAQDVQGTKLSGLIISDSTNANSSEEMLADSGRVVSVDGRPTIQLNNGQRIWVDENGELSVLDFGAYSIDLTEFLDKKQSIFLKPSDKYMHELFFIDRSNYFEAKDAPALLGEAHTRLTSPLINLVLGLLAIMAVTGGQFSRLGYSRRIGIAFGLALVILAVQLTIQSNARTDLGMILALWIYPLALVGVMSLVYFRPRGAKIIVQTADQEASA